MEPNDRSYRHHPVIRDEDAAHAAIRRSASADVAEQFGDTGALENGHDQQRPNVEQTFPNKLHYMLDHGLEESERDVIAWQPHGRAFLVLDQRRFVTELLPNWFRQNKYQSFQVGRASGGRTNDWAVHVYKSPVALTLLLALLIQQRQLNSYGFQRITQGRDKVGWMSSRLL